MINYLDKTLTCSDCGQQFTFTAGEQLAFAQNGLKTPSCCAFCRAARRIASGTGNLASGNRSEHPMYPAVCTNCGKQTSVPFEPRGGRPVYCRNCYEDRRQGSSGEYGRRQIRPSSYKLR